MASAPRHDQRRRGDDELNGHDGSDALAGGPGGEFGGGPGIDELSCES